MVHELPGFPAEIALSEIRYFLEVARLGNISRAAERLALRQSSLSAAMQRLERAVGAELLVRSRAGVRLTKSGELFRQSSQELVERWSALRAATRGAAAEITGSFSIGCHPTVARYVLPLFLPALAARHPALRVELIHERSNVLTEMVISGRVDFAIVTFPSAHPDLVVASFGRDVLGIFAHRDVDLRPESTALMVDLDVKGVDDVLHALDRRKVRFERLLTSSSVDALRALAESGYGAVILPRNSVLHARPRSELVLRRELPMVSYELRFIYRADTQRTAAGRAIARVIRDECAPLRRAGG